MNEQRDTAVLRMPFTMNVSGGHRDSRRLGLCLLVALHTASAQQYSSPDKIAALSLLKHAGPNLRQCGNDLLLG